MYILNSWLFCLDHGVHFTGFRWCRMKTLLKLVLSISLIVLLFYNIDWSHVLNNFNALSGWPVAVTLFVFIIQFPISAWKWKVSLRMHRLDFSFIYLQKILCIGFFFNNFLPSSVGGDAYRIIKTIPRDGYKSRAVSAVLVERIIGLASLVFFGFLGGVIILLNESIFFVKSYVMMSVTGGATGLIFYILVKAGVFNIFFARLKEIEKLKILFHNVGHIWRNPNMVYKIILISFLFQILAIIAISVLFDALGVEGGYEKYAFISAVVGLAVVLPLSINGIGIMEGALAVTAVQLGMGYNDAIIVAFTLRILVLPLSLICGIIYLIDSHT